MSASLVGSEMCIRDSYCIQQTGHWVAMSGIIWPPCAIAVSLAIHMWALALGRPDSGWHHVHQPRAVAPCRDIQA
eukprot:4579932-Alexandrium_andersonii.AAC.1